jgi:hypothetical protein
MWIGPFWRQRPTTVTSHETWGWCYVYLNSRGEVGMIEWHS